MLEEWKDFVHQIAHKFCKWKGLSKFRDKCKIKGTGMLERKMYLVSALFFIGIIVLVISIVTGFLSGTFFGFSIALLSGIVSGMIFFALAHILNNQQSILFKLHQLEEIHNKQIKQENKQCSNCNYEYNVKMNSCPNCGRRE